MEARTGVQARGLTPAPDIWLAFTLMRMVCGSAWPTQLLHWRGKAELGDRSLISFAQWLRRLRIRAGLTQEELAEAARLSARSVSDLERGINLTARRETARLLADALSLAGPERAEFEQAARGGVVRGVPGAPAAAPATRPG